MRTGKSFIPCDDWTDKEKVMYTLYVASLIMDSQERLCSSNFISKWENINLSQKQVLKILHELRDSGYVGYSKKMVYSEWDEKFHPFQGWYCTRKMFSERVYDKALDDETRVFTEVYGDEINTFESNRKFLDWWRHEEIKLDLPYEEAK